MAEQVAAAKRQWTSRSVASRFQHAFFYRLIRLGGRRPAYWFLRLVVGWYTLLRPSIRKRSYPYLRRRFPKAKGLTLMRHSYKLSVRFGQVLVDRAALGLLGPKCLEARFEQGRDAFVSLLAEGRGCILMGAHVGSWQAAMASIDFLRTPVNMLLAREAGDVDRHWFEHLGLQSPFRVIDPAGPLGGAVEMAAALRRGEVLCVMGDRVFGTDRNVAWLPFLGDPAPFPVSAYRLASASGAPIAVLFSRKSGYSSYDLELGGVIRVPPSIGRGPEACKPYAQQFVTMLEAYCLRRPYQFFNFYDMWSPQDQEQP